MNEIQVWLANPSRDYFEGVKLYNQYGDNIRLKHRVFPAGDFVNNKELLHYELSKLLKIPVVLDSKTIIVAVIDPVPPIMVQIPDSPAGYLRKEFPKLDFATIPDQLKILIIDRIALFNTANEAREKKFEATSDSERLLHNSTEIQARIENKLIWDELNHYSTTGKVLGKHRTLVRLKDLETIQGLNKEQLFNMKKNFPPSISKAKSAINLAAGDEKIIARKNILLEKYAWQEKEVDRLLGI